MATLPLKKRLLALLWVWIAGLLLATAVFFIADFKDARWYLLAASNFPVGLLAPLTGLFDHGLPTPLLLALWAGYFGVSGWLAWTRDARVFWWGLAIFALVVVLNIGGCAYIVTH